MVDKLLEQLGVNKRKHSTVFISYRREDSSGHTGRLYDTLSDFFDSNYFFMDIDKKSIRPGDNFKQVIEDKIASCVFLIAVIGKQWLNATKDGSRRLDNPMDLVRREIAAALNQNVRVIPVLVQNALMPQEEELPDELKPLATIHAIEISDTRWDYDVEKLRDVLSPSLGKPKTPASSGKIGNLIKKLVGFSIIFISLIIFFFRRDIIVRLFLAEVTPPVEELFFPLFLLLIGLVTLTYRLK